MTRGNEFSDDEKQFIRDNKEKKFVREMAHTLDRSILGVKKVIRQMEEEKETD
jgi:hypothetical protein